MSHVTVDNQRLLLWCDAVMGNVRSERRREKKSIIDEIVKRKNCGWFRRLLGLRPVTYNEIEEDLARLKMDWYHPLWMVDAIGGAASQTAKKLRRLASVNVSVQLSSDDVSSMSGWTTDEQMSQIFGQSSQYR